MSSLKKDDTALPLRFPFQQKAKPFLLTEKSY